MSPPPSRCTNYANVQRKELCNFGHDLCMKIVSNSDDFLEMSCRDRVYNIGNKIQWKINNEVIPSNSNNESESCIAINWSQLKKDEKNIVLCFTKEHPGEPVWQQVDGKVSKTTELEFKRW